MDEEQLRRALDEHWRASAAGDIDTEHAIYEDDAICDYPQSGERMFGRSNLQALRSQRPGKPNLWITEYTITYQGRPAYTMSSWVSGMGTSRTKRSISPIPSKLRRSQWVQRAG